jgi:hypothetical protein
MREQRIEPVKIDNLVATTHQDIGVKVGRLIDKVPERPLALALLVMAMLLLPMGPQCQPSGRKRSEAADSDSDKAHENNGINQFH